MTPRQWLRDLRRRWVFWRMNRALRRMCTDMERLAWEGYKAGMAVREWGAAWENMKRAAGGCVGSGRR